MGISSVMHVTDCSMYYIMNVFIRHSPALTGVFIMGYTMESYWYLWKRIGIPLIFLLRHNFLTSNCEKIMLCRHNVWRNTPIIMMIARYNYFAVHV